MHNTTLLIALNFFLLATTFGQTGYTIQFAVRGLKDTTAYLGYYSGENSYIRDTAIVDSKGQFKFEGKKSLTQGIYILVLDKTSVLEFVIGNNQHFTLETNKEDYIKSIKVKNDVDNKLFFENAIFEAEERKKADPFIKVIQDSTVTEEKKKEARKAFSKIADRVLAYKDDIIKKNPATMTARWLKANKAVRIPDPPKKTDGSIDSTFQLHWYRQHFFDHFDLSDDALINVPGRLYSRKVNEYLDKLYPPQKDTINAVIDRLIINAKKNPETYRYLVSTCMIKYQTPEIMGMDEVFVHLYDKYFATGEMDFWANDKMKGNVKDYANRIRLSMLGTQAPDLIMKDPSDQIRSLYNIRSKYTIVFFFDPDCGHCRNETPKLVEFYNKDKVKYAIDVFSVSVDSSMTKLKDFIKEFKTPWTTVNFYYSAVGHYQHLYDAVMLPTLYVLDEKKKIIGKKIPIEKLGDFLTNYEKFNKKTGISSAIN